MFRSPFGRSRYLLSVALCSLIATPVLAQSSGGASPVTVIEVTAADYLKTTRLPGRVKASTVAEVRPQVSGIIRERLFEEGTLVTEGQPIYKIQDESYAAAVAAAEASVAQARANFELAKLEEARALELFGSQAGSAQKRDSAQANRQAAEAGVMAAEAGLSAAQIDLDRTTIRAPITGVIGLSQTTTGALVAAQQGAALTTIRNLDTVFVDVTQSAVDILHWSSTPENRAMRTEGEAKMTLADGTVYEHTGRLAAAEPQVEPTTGMVTLRMSYPNPDHMLLPGMYVEVNLPQAVAKGAVAVPQNTVMRDHAGGAAVWVVEDGVVVARQVEVFEASANQWIVTSGLTSGDQVITSGFQKTGPGAPVTIIPNDAQEAE